MNCKQQLGATATATATAPERFKSRVEERNTPLYEAGYQYLESQSIETPVIPDALAEFTTWCHTIGFTHPHDINTQTVRGFRMYEDASKGVVYEIHQFLQHTHTPKIQYHPAFRVKEFLVQEEQSPLQITSDWEWLSALIAYCDEHDIDRIETGSEPVFEDDTLREWIKSELTGIEKLQCQLHSPIERFREWVEQTAAETQGDA